MPTYDESQNLEKVVAGVRHFGHDVLVVDDAPTAGVSGTSPALCALAPVGLLAELTHRCPLQCSYCSNPLELERVNKELTTAEWVSVMEQAGAMGILQVHLSGGEPTARKDLEDIVSAASKAGLYTNLITAAVTLTRPRLEELVPPPLARPGRHDPCAGAVSAGGRSFVYM